jgi:uncharacterized protein (TIGR00251 family)
MSTEPTALVTELADGVCFRIHLQPRASRTEISGIQGEEIKMRVTSPPVDDAANILCIEYLARRLGVAKSKVSIVAGSKSRHKTIKITGVTREAVLALVQS